jgi:hypothetical protein
MINFFGGVKILKQNLDLVIWHISGTCHQMIERNLDMIVRGEGPLRGEQPAELGQIGDIVQGVPAGTENLDRVGIELDSSTILFLV